jgi:hypothetical protein
MVELHLALAAERRRRRRRGGLGRHDHSMAAAADAWDATAVAGDGTVGTSWWHTAERGVNADIVAARTISCEIRTRKSPSLRDALRPRTLAFRR